MITNKLVELAQEVKSNHEEHALAHRIAEYVLMIRELPKFAYKVMQNGKYEHNSAARKLAHMILVDYDPSFFLRSEQDKKRVIALLHTNTAPDAESPRKISS